MEGAKDSSDSMLPLKRALQHITSTHKHGRISQARYKHGRITQNNFRLCNHPSANKFQKQLPFPIFFCSWPILHIGTIIYARSLIFCMYTLYTALCSTEKEATIAFIEWICKSCILRQEPNYRRERVMFPRFKSHSRAPSHFSQGMIWKLFSSYHFNSVLNS